MDQGAPPRPSTVNCWKPKDIFHRRGDAAQGRGVLPCSAAGRPQVRVRALGPAKGSPGARSHLFPEAVLVFLPRPWTNRERERDLWCTELGGGGPCASRSWGPACPASCRPSSFVRPASMTSRSTRRPIDWVARGGRTSTRGYR